MTVWGNPEIQNTKHSLGAKQLSTIIIASMMVPIRISALQSNISSQQLNSEKTWKHASYNIAALTKKCTYWSHNATFFTSLIF